MRICKQSGWSTTVTGRRAPPCPSQEPKCHSEETVRLPVRLSPLSTHDVTAFFIHQATMDHIPLERQVQRKNNTVYALSWRKILLHACSNETTDPGPTWEPLASRPVPPSTRNNTCLQLLPNLISCLAPEGCEKNPDHTEFSETICYIHLAAWGELNEFNYTLIVRL